MLSYIQLNEINTRVGKVLQDYDAATSQEEVFQLLDDESVQFTSLWDDKSILADSQGKVCYNFFLISKLR